MALISNGTTVASGGSVSVSSSAVGSATAGLSAGAVGSYASLQTFVNRTDTFGYTESGSNLSPSSFMGSTTGSTVSGTWRLMGQRQYNNNFYGYNSSVYLRIS